MHLRAVRHESSKNSHDLAAPTGTTMSRCPPSKDRRSHVQVLHGFDTAEQANAYLKTGLFTSDVVGALKPLLDAAPDIRIYEAA